MHPIGFAGLDGAAGGGTSEPGRCGFRQPHSGALITPLKPAFDCPQDSAALLEEAQVSLDAVVFGDPILAPATLAALLNYAADEMALPLEAATAVSVLTDIQVSS